MTFLKICTKIRFALARVCFLLPIFVYQEEKTDKNIYLYFLERARAKQQMYMNASMCYIITH